MMTMMTISSKSSISTVSNSTISRDTSMSVVNTSYNSNIMGMSCCISIVDWEPMMNLAESVSIRIRLGIRVSFALSKEASDTSIAGIAMMSISSKSSISTVSNSAISRDTSMSIVNTSYNSDIVGMSCSIGIVNWESLMNLAESVSFSIRLGIRISFTLSIEASDTSIASIAMMSISSISSISTVSNSAISRDTSMSKINASYNSNIMGMSGSISIVDWESMMDLSEGVSFSICIRL